MLSDARRFIDVRGIVASIVFILLGAAAIYTSRSFDALGSVFPRTIGATMMVLAAFYIVVAGLGRGVPVEALDGSIWRRVGIFAILLIWSMLIEILGFLTASLLSYCAALLIANFDRWTPQRVITYAAVGSTIVAGLFLLFGQVLKVSFPTGMLI